MFDTLVSLIQAANTLTPFGIIGLLVAVIILMVHDKGPIKNIANNHLSHLQGSLEQIAESTSMAVEVTRQVASTSAKSVDLLVDIKSDIAFVKGKLD